MDYFQTVGELGLGSRLKRLSDRFMGEVKSLYEGEGVSFEPRWFPLFSLLLQRGDLTVTGAATELKLTHPHVSQLAKELVVAKLAAFRSNPKDARSRVLALTPKGKALAKRMQPLWERIRAAVGQIVQECDPQFLNRLEKIEEALERGPLAQRTKSLERKTVTEQCRIRDFSPELQEHFERLNREWIEKYFEIEPHDLKYFSNPKKEIIQKGGDVFFAEIGGEIVGTCAIIRDKRGFELAKLAVTDRAKGKGIGELLSLEAIRRAKRLGAKTLRLTTNSRLVPAVRLYEKLGFQEIYRGHHSEYKRVDLTMEKVFGKKN